MYDLHNPKSSAGVRWVQTWRKVYRPLGFKKGYNFPLFVILVGALMGFVLSRFMYLDINGIFLGPGGGSPIDGLHYRHGVKRVGIILHLATILPAGFLVCFQFVPIIRYKAILFHRLNGYFIILLFLLSLAGSFIITPISANGDISAQTGLGLLGTITLISISFAYYNIKRLRIDLHREWMIRTWVYAATIISLRIIQHIVWSYFENFPGGNWYTVQSCRQVFEQYKVFGVPDFQNPTMKIYPQCTAPNSTLHIGIPVSTPAGIPSGPEISSSRVSITFGTSLWLALFVHALGVELYFRLTPAESQRLRQVSREKRIEAGLEKPTMLDETKHVDGSVTA